MNARGSYKRSRTISKRLPTLTKPCFWSYSNKVAMPSIMKRIRYWLENHNPFEAASTRSARQRLRESNATYGESNAQIRHDIGADG